ncbi:hypothetical protein CCO03_11840 [Comamonas serinivorans]|uniref:Peptidase n=1 Tax=Comamonas serinivorans TaxID=1082851 RepID=A0A1Y0EPP8_9BURK|nr:PepSY-associated TM helix domain-containing protein [Comamonas serinivorans]ARU05279.1 hypothetical protein CCO03_11840 [Comamonas serinivorans]
MTAPAASSPRRAYWLKTLHEWHWVSSAICLLAMVLFAVTGFTLNHAADIEAKPRITQGETTVPAALLDTLNAEQAKLPQNGAHRTPVPAALARWLAHTWQLDASGQEAEWSDGELMVSLPRPGGDAWARIDLDAGQAEYELTDRGWIAYFNDLHKGRHTGSAWRWFIDVFAAACLVFCITGLFILKMHAAKRPFTWPMVGLGLVVPAVLALLFIH